MAFSQVKSENGVTVRLRGTAIMKKVTRPVEKQMEFPVLELIIHPAGEHPVSLILEGDWYVTGEVRLSYTTAQSLEDACRLVDHARNHIADELLLARKIERFHAVGKKEDPPF